MAERQGQVKQERSDIKGGTVPKAVADKVSALSKGAAPSAVEKSSLAGPVAGGAFRAVSASTGTPTVPWGVPDYGLLFGSDGSLRGTENVDVGGGLVRYEGAVVAGETVTASFEIDNSDSGPLVNGKVTDTPHRVHVTWSVQCGGASTDFDLGQVVDSHSSYLAMTDPAIKALAPRVSFTTTVDPATCDLSLEPRYSAFSITAAATIVDIDGGNAGSATVGAHVVSGIPDSQTYGCPCGGSSAGFAQPQAARGDPVNTATGAYTESLTDAAFSGRGVPLVVARSYASNNSASGPLGPGWSLLWAASLAVGSSGDVTFTDEEGAQYVYHKQRDGSYVAPLTARSVLKSNGGGGFVLAREDHQTLTFDSSGHLVSRQDSSGQGLTFAYTSGQLSSVTDAAGRSASLSYTGGLLTRVTLSTGGRIDYGFTGGLLTSVTGLDGATTAYGYDSAGRLNSVKDPLGNAQVRNAYDTHGRVVSQQDALGATTTFNYLAGETDTVAPDGGVWTDIYAGNILMAQYDPFGNKTTYGHDGYINTVLITDPLGNSTVRSFDAAGHVTQVVPPGGRSQTWSYDAAGNLTRASDANYHDTVYGYDSNYRLTSVKDPAGGTATLTYTPTGQLSSATSPGGKTTAYGYDSQGNQVSVTSPTGAKTTRTFDSAGWPLTVTDPRGNVAGADPASFTASFTYDAAHRVTAAKDPLGNITAVGYDSAGNKVSTTDALGGITQYGYDAGNRVTSTTDPAGHKSSIGYDTVGNIASRTDPTGATSRYTYDKAKHLLSLTTPRGNATGAKQADFTWRYGYDQAGRQVTTTDPLGHTTQVTYDTLSRPVSTTDALGRIRSVTYDSVGNVLTRKDGLGQQTGLTYDALDRLTKVETPLRDAVTFQFDADGNLVAQTTQLGERTTYGYDADGHRTTTVDPRGNVTGANPADYTWTTAYDAAGQTIAVTDPLGNARSSTYDANGNLLSSTDALGNATRYSYDVLNRATAITAPDGGITSQAYNPDGTLASRTDAEKHTTTYAYSALGQVTSVTDPLARTVTFTYDADGNRTQATNARGQSITSDHDAFGRITKVGYSDGTPTVTYAFDEVGHPVGVTDATGTRNLTYDNADRLLSVSAPGLPNGFRYTYDNNGNLTGRTFPDGRATTFLYDDDDRVTAQATDYKRIYFTYDKAGNLLTSEAPTSTTVKETRAYDRAGRLTSTSDASGTKTYTLDANGRVTAEQYQDTGSNPRPATFSSYDPAGRLTRSCTGAAADCAANQGTKYGYDKAGNLLTQTNPDGATATNTYDAGDQLTRRTAGSTSVDYTYDADGNQTKAGPATYAYDPAGRLTSATDASGAYGFTYDADGNRTAVSRNGTLDRTSRWDINGAFPQLATDTNSTGALIADYQAGPTGLPQSMNTPAGAFYFQHDRLGSITTLTDSAGKSQNTYAYTPLGDRTATASTTGSPTASPFGFTGQYIDPYLAGRIDLRARQYDTATGRFTTRDPLPGSGPASASSPYAYVGNDFTNQTDPSGACPMCVSALIGGVIGGVIGGGVYAWQHRDQGFSWSGFAAATGKGALIGVGAGLLAPIGGTAAAALGLEGLTATATAAGVNAVVGASYNWLVNTVQCQPTSPQDLLLGALSGAGGTLIGPAFRYVKGLRPGASSGAEIPEPTGPTSRGEAGAKSRPSYQYKEPAPQGWTPDGQLARGKDLASSAALGQRTSATASRSYVSGYHTDTGELAVASSGPGFTICEASFCAEGNLVQLLGGDWTEVQFGTAFVAESTEGGYLAVGKYVCPKCQADYPPSSFGPDVAGDPRGPWFRHEDR
ncbi:DUF6531 domain-containing protein [Kitasatospora sp. NPDC059599]|uniref:DUF6531 domain-containing protein n=1 Tax=Kitasatospora sp. NPDC059599 TaxID=3346880 RepID=UPI0036D0C21A